MGVLGLTSYVNQRSDVCFEPYHLSDCVLIIDGYGLAAQLYNSYSKINSSFGGDYDKYCKLITNFIENLKKCRVTPLVICDGGYEKKKFNTVKRRNLQRVYALEKISPSCCNLQCFPLMMRHVFREKLKELSVLIFQTDFEADSEIAALSRKLNAPVLSNDSDFFIYDVNYIPLTSMIFDRCEGKGKHCYIPCQIFSVNNLLKSFGNIPKTMLPLLATVLGNDYIKTSSFKEFYSHLKMDKTKKMRPGQRRVKGLVDWLKNETFESAMAKILQCMKKKARRNVKRNIKNIIKGYTNLESTLNDYLPEYIGDKNNIQSEEVLELINSFNSLCCTESSEESDNESVSSKELLGSSSDNPDSEVEEELEENESDVSSDEASVKNIDVTVPKNLLIPSWLLHESRLGNMCPSINTLLSIKVYFYCPQVEDYESDWAGSISLPILQVVLGLLGLSSINYWYRKKSKYVNSLLLSVKSVSGLDFPELDVLHMLSPSEKKLIIFKTLDVENPSILQSFPREWHLLLMSIVFWSKANESSIKYWHLHALIITIITINVIFRQVGPCWQKKTFLKKYGSKMKILLKNNVPKSLPFECKSTIEAIEMVTSDDCLIALDGLIPYFHVDENLNRNSKRFSRNIVHTYAQLQSTFELGVTLNSLLSHPFKRSHLGNFYNGTFLYNFTVNFKGRTNVLSYMQTLLGKAPSVLNLYIAVYNNLMLLIPDPPKQVVKVKKPKKRKEIKEVKMETCNEEMSDTDSFNDANNRYCLLSSQVIVNR
ncbi:protein asteroid [Halyomorpha halys]|uniref:protein asteroid n=1 Tax=Halyomorpha halys TaxID=286706 RepID=UPI0006D4C7E6|nr:protein asteroid [Halyomorpha halys]